MTTNPTLRPDILEARLLVVDDEPDILSALVEILRLEGFIVEKARSGQEALSLLESRSYDLMVLDLMLPDIEGIEILHRARQMYPDLLVIILTGNASMESAVDAVKLRATDYLFKPVSSHDLVNAVRKALKERAEQLHQQQLIQVALNALHRIEEFPVLSPTNSKPLLRVSPLILDRHKQLVMTEDNPEQAVELTEKETTVLAALMANPNQVLSCQELVQASWGRNTTEQEAENLIRPYIFRLRRKIETFPKYPELIKTARGRGYHFISKK